MVRLLRFGDFELDVRAGELRKRGIRIRLQEQSLQILLMLLDQPGEVVLRDEIQRKLWPNNTIVEFDHSINAAIKRLRTALGESAENPRFIETLAKRGYRFVGEVETLGLQCPETASAATPNALDGEPAKMVSHYRIVDKLGEGGMGVVYRAEDTKLGRMVALKFLPSPAGETPLAALKRFEGEARAASALNHPNICTIYGLENCDGQPAIVMELVEGETLAVQLAKRRLSLGEALRVASQTASALVEAQRKGVVHRDLKPANIMLTKSGVKVLDFGLAKIERDSVTNNEVATTDGAILGTPHYMSPEQALGKEADVRSDIFSFGVVLYEMLAGKRPFDAQSTRSVLAAILEREPQPLSDSVPAPLDRVVQRCLAKDPDERWQTPRDLQAELEWIAEAPLARQAGTATRLAPKIGWPWIVAGILAVALIALVVFQREKPAAAQLVRFHVFPPENNAFGGNPLPGVSPDGQRIIFGTILKGAGYRYWIRSLDSPEPSPIAAADGAYYTPFWSPDGRSVAFFAGNKLKKINLTGLASSTEAVTLCTAAGVEVGTWSRYGAILFSTERGPIYRVPDSGGSPVPATRLDEARQEGWHRHPWFLPDGRHFLFLASGPTETYTIRVGSLDSLESKVLLTADTDAVYSQGFLLYVRDEILLAQPFNVRKLALTGNAVPIAEPVLPFGSKGPFAASENGTLVYQSIGQAEPFELVWFDRNGNQLSTLGGVDSLYPPQLSPDGRTAAIGGREQRNTDIWLYDSARGNRTRFTFNPAIETAPIWSPDGRTIAFSINRNGHADLYRKMADHSGSEELLYADSDQKYPTSWSRDGRFLAFDRLSTKEPSPSLWVLPLQSESSSRAPFPLFQTQAGQGRFSPDGRWIVFQSGESGRSEIYVTPFSGEPAPGGAKRLISANGGSRPRWRADGKEIFYTQFRTLMAVSVETGDHSLKIGEPRQVIGPLSILGYDVTADGQHFLLRLRNPAVTSQPMTVVQNWTAALKK